MIHWQPTTWEHAQTAHFFISWAVVLTATEWMDLRWVLVGLLLWVLFKEFVFDLLVEQDSLNGSLTDTLFYGLGTLPALLVLKLRNRYASI